MVRPGEELDGLVEGPYHPHCGLYGPVPATYRLEHTGSDRVARTLSAWSVSSSAAIATMTALWGLLAAAIGARTAITAAGVLLPATPLLLPRRQGATREAREEAAGVV